MKTIKTLSLIFASFLMIGLTSCSSDDDSTPPPVNEEEVIMTLTLTLTPATGGSGPQVTMTSRDADGDGPNPPVVTVSGPLTFGTVYSGVVVVLNETETPPENITEEVIEEDEEHQFFFFNSGGLDVTVTYNDQDGNGNPLGVLTQVDASGVSSGNLRVVLRHEPNKPNDGTLADAGGETDIDVTFPVTVQ